MKITFLGTGTSQGVPVIGCSCPTCVSTDPRNTRYRTHAHVEIGNLNIQVDAAPEFRIQALKHSIPKVDMVLLTHGHADHVLGMDDLRRYCDMRDGKALPIYTNEEGEERMRSIYGYAIREKPKEYGYPAFSLFRMPPMLDLPDGVIHSFNQSHGNFESLGLVFIERCTSKKLAYFTDCDSVKKKAIERAAGADVVVLDGLRFKAHKSHMSVEQAIEVADQIGAKKTYLIHMTHHVNHAIDETKLPEKVRFAYDNLVVEIC